MLNEIDLSRVDLNLLVLFEAVMHERHVARAASRLNLTASAVSHGIARLRRTFNDPLFLKHPKGVVPTATASALAGPIAAILAQVREVVASADPFDPHRSRRRFTIGAPDAIAAVALPAALSAIGALAPNVIVCVREMQPMGTLPALDAGEIDVALYPLEDLPARFHGRLLYEERFVVAMRTDHPFRKRPTLEAYCAARHLLVSRVGDTRGFVDDILERERCSRRVVMTVPTFMSALALLGESDLLGTLPLSLMRVHAARFGLASVEAPFDIERFQTKVVAPHVAMRDAGVAWLMDILERTAREASRARARPVRGAKPRSRSTRTVSAK